MYKKYIEEDTYFRKLTLMVTPNCQSGVLNDYTDLGRADTMWFYELLRLKKGWNNVSGYYMPNFGPDEPVETLILQQGNIIVGNKQLLIGKYFKNRNLIVIGYDFFYYNLSLDGEHEIIPYFLNLLGEFVKRVNPQTVDVDNCIKEMLLKKFNISLKNRITEVKNEIGYSMNDITEFNRSIIEKYRNVRNKNVELMSLTSLQGDSIGKIKKEMEEIKKLDFVKSVRLTLNGVRVHINEIYIKHLKRNIRIGEFVITIKPNKIDIKNKTPIVGKEDYIGNLLHHPHIKNEHICFGDRSNKMNELLADFELKKLIYFIKLYLQSYNPGDKLVDIKEWTKRNQEKKELDEEDIYIENIQPNQLVEQEPEEEVEAEHDDNEGERDYELNPETTT